MDHVTWKTGRFAITGINKTFKFIKIENCYNIITVVIKLLI